MDKTPMGKQPFWSWQVRSLDLLHDLHLALPTQYGMKCVRGDPRALPTQPVPTVLRTLYTTRKATNVSATQHTAHRGSCRPDR